METQNGSGRFNASCVYSRWKWTTRFGLMVVPMLVLLCGGLILFLTQNKYRSTTLIEILFLEALVSGFLVALLLPYLCELTFPSQKIRDMPLNAVYNL